MFFILKTFCSTLISWIGELENSFFDVTNRLDNIKFICDLNSFGLKVGKTRQNWNFWETAEVCSTEYIQQIKKSVQKYLQKYFITISSFKTNMILFIIKSEMGKCWWCKVTATNSSNYLLHVCFKIKKNFIQGCHIMG